MDTPRTAVMSTNSTTSIRRSPFSYLATKDCGLPNAIANSACVIPLALRASTSRDCRSIYRGVRKDFCIREGSPLKKGSCSANPDSGLSHFRILMSRRSEGGPCNAGATRT